MSIKNWVRFIFLGLVCGSTFMLIKLALREINPFTIVFYRVLLAGIGLGVYFLFIRRRFDLRWWWVYAFIGFFNVALPFSLISWAENYISSGLASILNSTVPIFTALFAAIFYKEDKFTLNSAIALVMGFFGVLVLSYTKLEVISEYRTLGIIALLVASCGYSASNVFARRVDKFVSPEDHSLGQMVAALLFITLAMFATNTPVTIPANQTTWIALLWLGIVVSFIAALQWFKLIYETGPSRASMMIYMFPLVGVLLGVIFLGEKVDWQTILGGLLILSGVYVVNAKSVSKQVITMTGGMLSVDNNEKND